jgi:hypothetical protein
MFIHLAYRKLFSGDVKMKGYIFIHYRELPRLAKKKLIPNKNWIQWIQCVCVCVCVRARALTQTPILHEFLLDPSLYSAAFAFTNTC